MKPLFLLLLLCGGTAAAQDTPVWENPQVVGIDKLPYHATLTLPSRENECGEVTSLCGRWQFRWSANPDERPADFYRTDYDASSWDSITVPGHWQLQGYGRPIYTNMPYPFQRDAPRVTSEPPRDFYAYDHRNPVGSYLTTIRLDKKDRQARYLLHFDGVKSAMFVWVNGVRVGYSQNSMSPAEFDITNQLRRGDNRLAVEVYRWSDGSYLEDQDMWRFSGIFRPVTLWKRPATHIRDYSIEATPNTDLSNATITARFALQGAKQAKRNARIALHIHGHGYDRTVSMPISRNDSATLTTDIPRPALWCAEKPNLYDVDITLLQGETATEHFVTHLGVRRVEVRGEVLYLNNKPIKLMGVNRHEHHPTKGRCVDSITIATDLRLMKEANINMVRTSHYPNTPLFYELCDRMGIYVMDEANQESHGYGIGNREIGDNPLWSKAHTDRAVSLVVRDRNHPSVIFWSLGNEAGAGLNARLMADTIRSIDPHRIVYYDSDLSVSDIYDFGYPSPTKLKEVGERVSDRPVFMREYAHAMGNSGGNLKEFWDIIHADSSIVGGAIWDWVDQALYRDGAWLYGGDYGDRPNDGPFCINGLIAANRLPHPHYYEVQKVYQSIDFALTADSSRVQVVNRYPFCGNDEFAFSCDVLADGRLVGIHNLALADDATLALPDVADIAGEVFVNIYAQREGRVVAKEQFLMKSAPRTAVLPTATTQQGEAMLPVIEPYFWKPANDNQRRNGYEQRLGAWRNVPRTMLSADSTATTRRVVERLGVGATLTTVTTRTAPNQWHVSLSYQPDAGAQLPLMPKFGVRMQLPADMNQVEWYGRGPWENYPDRKSGAFVGAYSSRLEDFITPYVVPQDNACRCDVRWAQFRGDKKAVTIEGDAPFCLRAWPYDEADLESCKHNHELPRRDHITVNIDADIHGVGGNDSWGARTLDAYTLDANQPRQMGFTITLH